MTINERYIFLTAEERGQGLVEYALILVLVAVVVIGVLMILGPVVGNVFSDVTDVLLYAGGVQRVLLGASAERTGFGSGNDVIVTVEVSQSVTVTATDSQSGHSSSFACDDTCQSQISSVGDNAGSITVEANGESRTASYPAKP